MPPVMVGIPETGRAFPLLRLAFCLMWGPDNLAVGSSELRAPVFSLPGYLELHSLMLLAPTVSGFKESRSRPWPWCWLSSVPAQMPPLSGLGVRVSR